MSQVNILNSDTFSAYFTVSRETSECLEGYVELIKKWNASINLVSRSTIIEIWHRHIADSAQLFGAISTENSDSWLDIGSGAGLPGIVIAILSKDRPQPMKVVLVESDTRKCAFLRTAIREFDLNAIVIEDRIEAIPTLNADVISARAFKQLPELLALSHFHGSPDVTCLFLKGQSFNAELTEAQESWNIRFESLISITDSSSRILKIRGISPAHDQ